MESIANLTQEELAKKIIEAENFLSMIRFAKKINDITVLQSQKIESVAIVVPQKTEQVAAVVLQKTEQAVAIPQKTEQVAAVPQKTQKTKNFIFPKGTFMGKNKCLYCEDVISRVKTGSFKTNKGFDEPIQSFNKDGSFHCHQAGKFFRNKRCFECEKRVFGHVLPKDDWRITEKAVGTICVQYESFEGLPCHFIEMAETFTEGYDIIDHGECTHFQ